MFEQNLDHILGVLDFNLVLCLLFFELFCKIIDFLFFLVQNFKFLGLLRFIASHRSTFQVSVDFFDGALVGLHHLAHVSDFLVLHLYLSVVVLDSVH